MKSARRYTVIFISLALNIGWRVGLAGYPRSLAKLFDWRKVRRDVASSIKTAKKQP